MQSLLKYINNPEDPNTNKALADDYFSKQQYPAALSFYLRAADRYTTGDEYNCLLSAASCLANLGRRDSSVVAIYKRSIAISPNRPEAYIQLSRFYEKNKQWLDCYLISYLGFTNTNNVVLEFQLAVSSWWVGYYKDSRQFFRNLAFNRWNELDDKHKESVEYNLQRLGSGPESQAFHTYNKNSKLKYSFKGSENITRNYSQTFQDLFVLTALNGKQNGKFLEIGGSDPFKGNNTALLEQLGWSGISIEIDEASVLSYRKQRPSTTVLHTDATKLDYDSLLKEYKHIDYLQLDIEPARNTFEALLSIPFHNTTFSVITYEHDYYIDRTRSYRDKSRRYLQSLGYELVVENVSPDEHSPFEDWYVHPAFVDKGRIKQLKNSSEITYIVDYFLAK